MQQFLVTDSEDTIIEIHQKQWKHIKNFLDKKKIFGLLDDLFWKALKSDIKFLKLDW